MRRDIGEDTAGLEGPSESTSVLSDAYLIPRSMNVVCPYLHSAYSLPRNSTPFSGFWRIDHRSLEATTGGGRKGWLAEPSPSPRQHHALAQKERPATLLIAHLFVSRISPPFLPSYECRHQTSRRSRT